ncbi:MAG: hypothetical protein B6241_13180 [Spirochaetaceae bacterium 4572_59]|nr:MAG: hypothetical protein B6241_13180 [Spirochaetaceae bacterium 4572_59]
MAVKTSRSIKTRFIRFISLSFVLLFIVVIFSNLQSYSFWQKYKRTFTLYDKVSSYYDQVEMMNVRLKDYIYTENSAEWKASQEYYLQAKLTIRELKTMGTGELPFRFGLLGNMLETYYEKMQHLLKLYPDYDAQKEYDSFVRLRFLIDETYPSYAKLITSEMNREKDMMLKSLKLQMFLTLFLFLFLFLFTLLFSISSVRGITRPIDKLISNINRIKGGTYQIHNVDSDSTEIRILLNAFEEMAEKIQNHIEMIREKSQIERQLIEEEVKNLKMTKLLAETRFNALQGQMNPHFLFNTLSMLSKQAYLEGAELTSDLMVSSAELLRYSLDMSTRTSTLEQEVKCVRHYFDIQQRRIGKRISLSLDLPQEIPELNLPGMILQPLLENSFIHGVKDKIKDAFISLTIELRDLSILIVIEDNGRGIDEKKLVELNNRDDVPSDSIGISNVRKRLQLYFQDNFQFRIESKKGEGSRIILQLPSEIQGRD